MVAGNSRRCVVYFFNRFGYCISKLLYASCVPMVFVNTLSASPNLKQACCCFQLYSFCGLNIRDRNNCTKCEFLGLDIPNLPIAARNVSQSGQE